MAKYKVIIDGEEVEVEKPTVAEDILKATNEAKVTNPNTSAIAVLEATKNAKVINPNSVGVKAAEVANDLIDSGKIINPYTFMSENITKRNEDLGAKAEETINYKPTFADNAYEVTPEDKAKIDSLYTPQPAVPEPRKQTARERYETRQFEYNLEDDPLWQQYLASAKRNGQRAMDDTMAKVAAQTGGIAGSYAVSAGAGAYNDYMQEANEVIPYLEQLAYQKYQNELNRDLNLYEMEEAERWEEAERNVALNVAQTKGVAGLTDRQKEVIYASGDSWIDGDKVITPGGELASDNTVQKEKDANEKAVTDEILSEWHKNGRLSDADMMYLREKGYWIDENGILVAPDGNTYATEGGYITGLEAKYKSGANLSPTEIQELEAAGYKYQNGMLYNKNGTLIPKEFMPYDEKQVALEDYNTNTWYGMSEENKQILKNYGFVFNEATGNLTDGTTEYAPYNGSTIENILWKYMAGGNLTYDEMMFIGKRDGYGWGEDGKLYLNGEEVKKIINEEAVKSLDGGEIPVDLGAVWNEIANKRITGGALSANAYETLYKYGFTLSNGQWIQQATGKSLESFFGDATLTYNPGGTQSGNNTTNYRRTPYVDRTVDVTETPEATPETTTTPAPKTTPSTVYSSSGNTAAETVTNVLVEDRNPYNSVLGTAETLLMLGDVNGARQVLTEGVDSGKITIAQLNKFFDTYDDWF